MIQDAKAELKSNKRARISVSSITVTVQYMRWANALEPDGSQDMRGTVSCGVRVLYGLAFAPRFHPSDS